MTIFVSLATISANAYEYCAGLRDVNTCIEFNTDGSLQIHGRSHGTTVSIPDSIHAVKLVSGSITALAVNFDAQGRVVMDQVDGQARWTLSCRTSTEGHPYLFLMRDPQTSPEIKGQIIFPFGPAENIYQREDHFRAALPIWAELCR